MAVTRKLTVWQIVVLYHLSKDQTPADASAMIVRMRMRRSRSALLAMKSTLARLYNLGLVDRTPNHLYVINKIGLMMKDEAEVNPVDALDRIVNRSETLLLSIIDLFHDTDVKLPREDYTVQRVLFESVKLLRLLYVIPKYRRKANESNQMVRAVALIKDMQSVRVNRSESKRIDTK